MNFDCNEFYKCVTVKCRTEIISKDAPQGLIGKFTEIPIDWSLNNDFCEIHISTPQ